jgi:antitoxin HigA-1
VADDTVMAQVHPGEILLEEFLQPLGVSQYQLAKTVAVPARRINEVVHGQRRVTADSALRLSRYFGISERFWLNLRPATTWRPRRTDSAPNSTESSRSAKQANHKADDSSAPATCAHVAASGNSGAVHLRAGRQRRMG